MDHYENNKYFIEIFKITNYNFPKPIKNMLFFKNVLCFY